MQIPFRGPLRGPLWLNSSSAPFYFDLFLRSRRTPPVMRGGDVAGKIAPGVFG